MTWMRRQLAKDEGFTLIELMVVVLIIAILIAIAIPTFLGARERAQDRAAQSDLRNALTAEKVYYVDAEAYTTDATSLEAIEPSLSFVAGTAADADNVGVTVASQDSITNSIVVLNKQSASGTFFCIADVAAGSTIQPGTYFGTGTDAASTDATGDCASASW